MAKLSPAAFLSYVNADDKYGQVSTLRERLSDEVRTQIGVEFPIFQDRKDIEWGQNWQQRLEESLDAVTFLIPIITPSFFNSSFCRKELRRFLEREKELNRSDLILPIYFVDTPLINEEDLCAEDELAQAIASRQYADWRELRFEPFTNPQVGKTLERLARQIRDALPRVQQPKKTTVPPAVPAETQSAKSSDNETGAQEATRSPAKNEPPTCIVDQLHRGDFTTITEAVEKSAPGTKIVVQPGLYQEGIVIDKPLEIVGDGELGDVVVQASGKNVILFQTIMGRVTNLTLRQIGGGQWFAVNISQGRLVLEDCDITSQSLSCVAISNGADPILRRNRIHDGKQGGVYIYYNGQGTLEDNDIFGNTRSGVEITLSGNPTLRRNRIHDNKQAGVYVQENGRGILEDNDILDNANAGVVVKSGGNPTLRRNRINKNGYEAVWIFESGGGTFEGNNLSDNVRGAWDIAADSEANVKRANNQE